MANNSNEQQKKSSTSKKLKKKVEYSKEGRYAGALGAALLAKEL